MAAGAGAFVIVAEFEVRPEAIDAFLEAGEVLGKRLADAGCRPASTLLGVARLAFPEYLIELEATAVA